MKYHTIQKLDQAKDAALNDLIPAALAQDVARHEKDLSNIFGIAARKRLDDFRDMRDTRIVLATLTGVSARGGMKRHFPAFITGKPFIRSREAMERKNLRDVFPGMKYGELLEVKHELEKAGFRFRGFTVKKAAPGAPAP